MDQVLNAVLSNFWRGCIYSTVCGIFLLAVFIVIMSLIVEAIRDSNS